jgi:hypothetical protein
LRILGQPCGFHPQVYAKVRAQVAAGRDRVLEYVLDVRDDPAAAASRPSGGGGHAQQQAEGKIHRVDPKLAS